MDKKISVNPDQLDSLANTLVSSLTAIKDEYKQLSLDLHSLIMQAPFEYKQCFSGVGDPSDTGASLADNLNDLEMYVRSAGNKLADADNLLGKLYGLHQQYGNLTALGALSARQAAYYGIGLTKFAKDAGGAYSFKHMKALQAFSDMVDNSKYKKVARGFLKVTYMRSKFDKYSFADLIHKKFAKYAPSQVVDYANATKSLVRTMGKKAVTKETLKAFGKAGLKFAKANAVTTFLVTGASSSVGAGLKIAENYEKYGNNSEVLKRENAKAVGKAVNDTVVVGTSSIAGGVIGGAVGSLLGPVGTVAGAAAGSFVGGIVGEKLAKFTAPFAEKAAVVFKEPLHHAINTVRSGWEAAGKGVKAFNDGVDYANEQIKETLADPIGKAKDVTKEVSKGISKAKDTAKSLVNGATSFMKGKFSFG